MQNVDYMACGVTFEQIKLLKEAGAKYVYFSYSKTDYKVNYFFSEKLGENLYNEVGYKIISMGNFGFNLINRKHPIQENKLCAIDWFYFEQDLKANVLKGVQPR